MTILILHGIGGMDVQPTVIPGGGHLNTERGYTTFPKLLQAVLQGLESA